MKRILEIIHDLLALLRKVHDDAVEKAKFPVGKKAAR